MKSESRISSQNSDAVNSLRPRSKSLSLDIRSSDNSDDSKKLQDSDSLKLSSSMDSEEVKKIGKREEHCQSPNGSQTDTQTVDDTLDPDEGGDPHQLSPSTSDTVLLDLNENEAEIGKVMREISQKIPSNDFTYTTCMTSVNNVTYTTCMTSVTTVSQERESMEEFSPVKKSKFSNVPSSLDVQRLMQHQVPERGCQDEPNPLQKSLKAKEGTVKVKSKGSKSTPQCQTVVGTPEKTFVSETQDTEKSPEEIPKSPDPPAKRRKKRVSQQVTVEEKGECPLCGRGMSMKVLQEHAVYCNGSNRSSLTRSTERRRCKNKN